LGHTSFAVQGQKLPTYLKLLVKLGEGESMNKHGHIRGRDPSWLDQRVTLRRQWVCHGAVRCRPRPLSARGLLRQEARNGWRAYWMGLNGRRECDGWMNEHEVCLERRGVSELASLLELREDQVRKAVVCCAIARSLLYHVRWCCSCPKGLGVVEWESSQLMRGKASGTKQVPLAQGVLCSC
jgi:hypothetical protein